MDSAQLLPIAFLMCLYLAFGYAIALWIPFYRNETAPRSRSRFAPLDGLRGYLAIGVFFHHAVINYTFLKTGNWLIPGPALHALLGEGTVACFFMITAFLFWSKTVNAKGKMDWGTLYAGRLRRIAPMYLFSALVVGCCVLLASRGIDRGPLRDAIGPFARLCSLGVFNWRPLFGVSPELWDAKVTWTLAYEWKFYLALPVLAVLSTPRKFVVFVAAFLALGILTGQSIEWSRYSLFVYGMAAVECVRGLEWTKSLAGKTAGVFCLTLLVALPLVSHTIYATLPSLMLFTAFLCFVSGNTLFGLLTNRGAKQLGAISFSIYLVHGTVLRIGSVVLTRFVDPAAITLPSSWLFAALCGFITIAISSVTYRYIEYPFIKSSASPSAQPHASGIVPETGPVALGTIASVPDLSSSTAPVRTHPGSERPIFS